MRPISVGVVAANWPLSRDFHFVKRDKVRRLVSPGLAAVPDTVTTKVGAREWLITLSWSHEALAEAAYALTFWLMGEIGAVAFGKVPSPWPEMLPADAGKNAVKMMLYDAMFRCPTVVSKQRAVALYNTYGFGYALGMNFREKGGRGRRVKRWPEDLDEIATNRVTRSGCAIR